jgi:hypothetical protein
MRSPEAVWEESAYQDAPPHWADAWTVDAATIRTPVIAAAMVAVLRFVMPESLSPLIVRGRVRND